jgi:hypothetical protein
VLVQDLTAQPTSEQWSGLELPDSMRDARRHRVISQNGGESLASREEPLSGVSPRHRSFTGSTPR